MDDAESAHAAKVGHRKSRNGCSKCKMRRVKCDEVRPVCSNCMRLRLGCSWPVLERQKRAENRAGKREQSENGDKEARARREIRGTANSSNPSNPPQPLHPFYSLEPLQPKHTSRSPTGFSAASTAVENLSSMRHSSGDSSSSSAPLSALLRMWTPQEEDVDVFLVPEAVADEFSLPESRARRLMEHRLMQNYILHLSVPFPVSPSTEWSSLWAKQLPPLALQHDSVLYALLAMSATSLLGGSVRGTVGGGCGSSDQELFTVRQAYLIAAMREQRRMVQSLTLASADAVCLASLLMLINAFAMLGERCVQPYAPPTEWLQLGRGSGAVIWLSVDAIEQSGEAGRAASVMCTIANAPPQFGFDESYFDASNRDLFASVLAPMPSDKSEVAQDDDDDNNDLLDDTSREAYEKTLAYVGSIHKAIHRREPIYVLTRRVQAFTMVVPPRFVDLVAASRPRALVVLAYFFAAVVQLSGVWWLGAGAGAGNDCIARRELRGIRSVLPDEWMGLMVWPLDAAGLI